MIRGLDAGFLLVDLMVWPNNPGYTAIICVRELHTVKNFAEQGITLIQVFNLALTKNEKQKLFLL